MNHTNTPRLCVCVGKRGRERETVRECVRKGCSHRDPIGHQNTVSRIHTS